MRSYPPLWVWLVSAAIVGLGVAWLHFSSSSREQVVRTHNFAVFSAQMDRFLADDQLSDDQFRVFCWGSSFTRQAIENRETLQEDIAFGELNVQVQKMYMAGANERSFPYLNELFEAAENLQPHLICIEDHLFAFADRNWKNSKLSKEFRFLIENKIMGRPSRKRKRERPDSFDSFHWKFESTQRKDTLSLPPIERSILSFSEHKELLQKLAFALDQKIPIVILNVPRAGIIEERLSTPKNEADIEALLQSYRALGFQIEYWKYPYYLPFSHYSDYAHMNPKGRKAYSAWLTSKMANLLQTRYPK